MDPIQQVIAEQLAKIREHERAASKSKMVVNALLESRGQPAMFAEEQDSMERDTTTLSIRSDQFYGQPLAGAIRTILELRRKQDRGPATVNEIFASLTEGGFAFDTRNEDNAKRGLRVSLTKNSVTFHKLPNGKYGLLEWYPNAKPKRTRLGATTDADAVGEDEDDDDLLGGEPVSTEEADDGESLVGLTRREQAQ